MTHTYQIEGIHCSGCVTKIKNELLKLGDITAAEVQLKSPQATVTMQRHISTDRLQQVISKAGAFTIKEQDHMMHFEETDNESKTWLITYKPLLIMFAFITGVSLISAVQGNEFDAMQWMKNFMAGFFLVFSLFKFLDIRGFADSYSAYDLLAKKIYGYGFVYPFIELGLGLAYLTNWQPIVTNFITIIVMSFSSIGVIKAVAYKTQIKCACLGAVFNLPMSTITIVEDLLMVAMSALMLFNLAG